MVNILVLGVGGNVSQGILKAIRRLNVETRVIGACVSEYSSGLYMCDEAYICPYANSDDFVEWVAKLCNLKKIDIIFSGVEENIMRLAKEIQYLECNTKAKFISSPYEKLLIGQDKYKTCEFLKKSNCNYPRFCYLDDSASAEKLIYACGFPLLAKPCNGKSSSGIMIIKNKTDYEKVKDLSGYVLEEYIGDESSEYTVGCYVDKFGNLADIIIMQRRLKNGSTFYAKVVDDDVIKQEAIKICKAYSPTGPLNIQMRKTNDNKAVCFELNVRFSGTTAIRSKFGYCDVEAMIKEYVLDEPIAESFNVIKGEVFRFENEIYILGNAVDIMKFKKKINSFSNCHIDYQEM